jgi:Pyruvate/2-oxoacid:ferredoxin oxidoreductase delta subunit
MVIWYALPWFIRKIQMATSCWIILNIHELLSGHSLWKNTILQCKKCPTFCKSTVYSNISLQDKHISHITCNNSPMVIWYALPWFRIHRKIQMATSCWIILNIHKLLSGHILWKNNILQCKKCLTFCKSTVYSNISLQDKHISQGGYSFGGAFSIIIEWIPSWLKSMIRWRRWIPTPACGFCS